MAFGPLALQKFLLAGAGFGIYVRMISSANEPRRGRMMSKEDVDAVKVKVKVKVKVPMPGLGKEHVKVWADQDGLMIEAPARYIHRVELPADTFKVDQIKAEMKAGVLRVTVPKMKVEKRKAHVGLILWLGQ